MVCTTAIRILDRTEGFDDYFPCGKKKCKLKHAINWFNLFIDKHNKEIISEVNRTKINI